MKVYKFPKGGISFSDMEAPEKNSSITAFLPVLSMIPLIQHIGEIVYPLVSVGDHVKEGQLIGKAKSQGQANIHAAIPGEILQSVSWEMIHGMENHAFVVRLGGEFDKSGRTPYPVQWEDLKPFTLKQLIAEYGVVEMEGSGQPLVEILDEFIESDTTLVVRCVLDDPWLVADYAVCRERLDAVVEGSLIVSKAVGVSSIIFAVSHKEKDLGELFLSEIAKHNVNASVVIVGSRYPQKNHRELSLVLKTYARDEGISLGSLLILGPSTLAAVYDAVKLKKPILERYIAVGGSAVQNPQIMKVRIGTRLHDIFNECGGFKAEPHSVIIGSPLAGRQAAGLDEPITKTSYAISAFLEADNSVMLSCISCGECRMVCPVELDPETLFKCLRKDMMPKAAKECHGCGCCDFVCPSRLPLSMVIQSVGYRD